MRRTTMKATVFFIELSDSDRNAINGAGWSSEVGQAYLAAKDGKVDASNVHLFKKAATLSINKMNSESVWTRLQNVHESWTDCGIIQCHTNFPRSMDVGDVIVWENGTMERCASVGFEPFNPGEFKETFI